MNIPNLDHNHNETHFDVSKNLLAVQMNAHVDILLTDLMATTKFTQTFTNTTDEPIEAVHSIPVPVNSTLVAFKVTKNNQAWVGKVYPQSEASHRYEDALENGDSAFQLKKSADDIYTLYLGNLLSKETLLIELELSFPITWLAGQGQVYLPLVMGERYGKSTLLPEEVMEHSFLAEYPLTLTVTTQGQLLDALVESSSHPLNPTASQNPNAQSYELEQASFLNKDFILKLNLAQEPSQPTSNPLTPTFEVWQTAEAETLGLVSLVTEPGAKEEAAPRDILFILDCSGSMQGTPIHQLKKAMAKMLGQMRPQDRFNLFPFGSTVKSLFKSAQPVNEATLLEAKRYVRRTLDANLGGTETVSAMLTALIDNQETRDTDLVLITDGDIWLEDNGDAKTRMLKSYLKQNNIRIFSIGVGHSTTEQTVKLFAEMSGGSYLLTNPHEDITFQIQSQFKRLFQQSLIIEVEASQTWVGQPAIYAGDGLMLPMSFDHLPEKCHITLTQGDTQTTYTLTPTVYGENQHIGSKKWVAQQRFATLPENKQPSFALQHQILTEVTDYLVEMQRAQSEKTDQIPSLVKMPMMEVMHDESPVENNQFTDIPMFSRRAPVEEQMEKMDSNRVEDVKSAYDIPNPSDDEWLNLKLDDVYDEPTEYENVMAFRTYLESLEDIDYPELDFDKLAALNVPQDIMERMRLAELEGVLHQHINSLLKLISLYEQKAKPWDFGWQGISALLDEI